MWLLWGSAALAGTDVLSEKAHVELEAGFYAGDRSLGVAPFELVGPDGRPIAGLDGPFAEYPLRDALVAGPRLELRVVDPPLRASLGVAAVFPEWDVASPEVAETGVAGPVVSSVRGAAMFDGVSTIGLELPTGLLVPFADLVGTVHVTDLALEVDGVPATFRSRSFSLGARGGVRLQVGKHTFAQAAGEVTPFGPSRWGATVGVGVAL
ncbi:MAG: hypothetical protein ABMA64_08110 [Myxococcota bacterium]